MGPHHTTVNHEPGHIHHSHGSHSTSHFSQSQSQATTVNVVQNVHKEVHHHHQEVEVIPIVHEHKVEVVNIVHEEDYDVDGPSPPGSMQCDARTGDWDSWCRCEWKLTCKVPEKPNAKYKCWEEDGLFKCSLTCKGNGQFVPAKWRDQWQFTCKRGIRIEREPQGCSY